MENNAKNADFYICESCDFKCSKKSNWTTHIMTSKHKNRTKLNDFEPKNAENNFTCQNCNKTYKARNSLWYHKQKCDSINKPIHNESNSDSNTEISDKNLILTLIQQNNELQKQMLDSVLFITMYLSKNNCVQT
jgi:hypothetical protein